MGKMISLTSFQNIFENRLVGDKLIIPFKLYQDVDNTLG